MKWLNTGCSHRCHSRLRRTSIVRQDSTPVVACISNEMLLHALHRPHAFVNTIRMQNVDEGTFG